MASDELELARLLRKRIETALTIQNWGEGSEAKFAPLYLAEEIIGPRIYELCRSIFESSSIAEETSGAFKTGEPKWRILAILLYIKCSKSFLRRFIEEDLSVNDSKLPLDLNSAQIFLGRETGTEFHDKQFIFIPAILKEGQEQQYVGEEGKRRLPFLAVKRIGHGSFGTVYRVTVARGHYFPKDSTMGPNHTDREFAWKEFQVTNKRAYESELRNVGIIRETSYREELCVVLSYGSLRRDTIFGLYFDLAECDLNQYLSERSTLPRTVKEIEFFFRCFQGLLDALVFLHTALKTNTGKGVCLIHRDLKPSNILVFKRGSKEEVWKLSDFGESEVLNQHPTEKRRLFGLSVGATQLPSQEDSTNSSMRPLRTGPFLAPETKTKRESNVSNVRAKSDVWSMGCILTILLAFLRDGSRTIEEFQRRRTGPTDGRNDFFFVVRGKKLVLNDAVKDTLESLVGDIRGALIDAADEASSNATSVTDFPPIQPEIVEKVAREMISLLQNNVLIVEPSGRADSQKFAQRFKDNMALFEAPYGQLNVRKPSISLGKMFGSTGSIKNETEPPRTWSLEIPTDSSSCRFSNCGNYLAFFSAEKISLYVMVGRGGVLFTDMKEDAKVGRRAKISKCPKGSPWSGFDVNSTHLVTFTSGKHLDLHIHSLLNIEQSSTLQSQQIKCPQVPRIHRVLLSPDGKILILVFHPEQFFYIYSSRMVDILNWSEGEVSNETTRSNPYVSRQLASSSTDTTSSHHEAPMLPWSSVLLNPPEYNGELDIEDIEDMRFSADSSLFTVLSHIPKKPGDKKTRKIFYSWPRTSDGQFSASQVKRVGRSIQGDFDVDESWDTAFVPVTQPHDSIFSITFTRSIAQFGLENSITMNDWASQELDIQILDVLPIPQEDRWIFIGREKRNKGTVKALFAPMKSNMNFKNKMQDIHFDFVLDFECTNWRAGRDSATTLNKGMQVLIARLDGTGFVRQIYRPIAERNYRY